MEKTFPNRIHKPREAWRFWSEQINPDGMVQWLRTRHPNKTATNIASELGTPVETVTHWLNRKTVPNGRTLVLMVCVYGPDFLASIIAHPPEWLAKAVNMVEQERLEAQIAAMQEELARQRALLGLSNSEGGS